ncbi:ABC transporter permease [Caldanaerobacter subterraneus]|uniref:ABC transporter permease n=1 Tax=Caldanaerobacter subterraneus TaxID=911092 RepID=A0A7Y2L7Y8_9THEO|nr:ABC transporter permease [Caldanaerobacter subterraneus]NNG67488.1 ABC transporter permease [Caldanaerobacter subterraneus]
MKMLEILKKELKSYFFSPAAYVLMGFYLLISGYFFSTFVLSTHYAELGPVLGSMVTVFMFVAPILTMRLISEDMKMGTDQLLLTSPVTVFDIVVGKFLSAVFVYLATLVITFIYPLYLKMYSSPDMGPIISGYIGLFLAGIAFISIGIFASSLTENQMIAGSLGFALILVFWIISWLGDVFTGKAKAIFKSLSFFDRLNNFQNGIVNLNDIVFFLSVVIFFIFATIRVIDKRRWS